jgi:hypothetical protein
VGVVFNEMFHKSPKTEAFGCVDKVGVIKVRALSKSKIKFERSGCKKLKMSR